MTPQHALDWFRDVRIRKPVKYTVLPDDPENRFQLFLKGWEDSHAPREWKSRVVNWRNLGRAFGSVLGNVAVEQRRAVYSFLLHQFVSGSKCRRWTVEEKAAALGHFGLTINDEA